MMRFSKGIPTLALLGVTLSFVTQAQAQTALNLNALKGLVAVTVLDKTEAGKAALAKNLTVTGAIQDGSANQPTLLPFPQQQDMALKDAFITGGNASELADGLGTKLGGVYQSAARYNGAKTFTNIAPSVAEVIAYANHISGSDSASGKFFLSNATTNGKTPVSSAALAILTEAGGTTDIFGKAYNLPGGSKGADPYGDSRPFQTEPKVTPITGDDYFGKPSTGAAYLSGPAQDLTASPAFPSGHTTYGYTEALLLAVMVPERFQQEITRAAEYGNDRIILGAHYTMDVIAGRTLASYDVAQLLANKAAYLNQPAHDAAPIADYQTALATAKADLTKALQAGCGATITVCATEDTSRFGKPAANETFYETTQTYGLPIVYPDTAKASEDVAKVAPEAGYLLTAAFPYLTLAQADTILTATEGPGGGFLDNGSAFGLYSRLNLYAAGEKAGAMAPAK